MRRNTDVPWDSFDSAAYKDMHYSYVRRHDELTLEHVRDFLATQGLCGGRGLDVGTGANLYPALAQLPFCDTVDLVDLSAANVTWLREQLGSPDASWGGFWRVLTGRLVYAQLGDYRQRLHRMRVTQGS